MWKCEFEIDGQIGPEWGVIEWGPTKPEFCRKEKVGLNWFRTLETKFWGIELWTLENEEMGFRSHWKGNQRWELGVVGTCLEFDQGKSEWGQRKRGIAQQSGG